MEEGRNIPLIIMLSAGSIVSIACIIYKFTLTHTLLFVLLTLVFFYIIGLIVKKIILTINRDAEERAALIESEKKEAQKKAEAEKKVTETEQAAAEATEENADEITVA